MNLSVAYALQTYFYDSFYVGLFDRDVAVINMALSRGIPCATVIGGGYDDDIDVLGRRHSIVHRAAGKVGWLVGWLVLFPLTPSVSHRGLAACYSTRRHTRENNSHRIYQLFLMQNFHLAQVS